MDRRERGRTGQEGRIEDRTCGKEKEEAGRLERGVDRRERGRTGQEVRREDRTRGRKRTG